MNEKNQKGLFTELNCQLAFTKIGITILAPITSDVRYDFVADIGGQFVRIQCKTCVTNDDKSMIRITTRSTRSNSHESYQRYYTKEEIDYFYTFFEGKSYLIKVEETSSAKTLRFKDKQATNTTQNMSWAEDYELEVVLKRDYDYEPIKFEHTISQKGSHKFCIDCGAPISDKATRCQSCQYKHLQKTKRPSREELKNMIRTEPFIQIGKQFGVTDNTIRKWCKNENLPYRKTDIKEYSDEEWAII